MLRKLRLAILLIGGIGVVGIYAWGFIAGNPTIVTAATALLVLVVGEHRRWQLAAQQDRWGRIAPQYEAFFRLLRALVAGDAQAKKHAQEETEAVMGEFGDKLMLWGSARVVKAWVEMRRKAADGAPSVSDAMSSYGKLLLAIRKEFGHEDLTLEEKDLFRVIFNDEIDTLIELDSSSGT
ncbi:MAG: hypothetical protein ACM3JL_01980 [Nitrososphaerota archaeon]